MMKQFITILMMSVLMSVPMSGQDVSMEGVKADIVAFSKKVSSIECDFVQVKESSLLAEKAVSSGHMNYRKPGYLEWKYLEPTPLTFTADGNNVALERDGKAGQLNGNQSRFVKKLTQLIISNIEGSILSDEMMFRSEFSMFDGNIMAVLYPQKKEIRKLWSKLVLHYDRETMGVRKFEMHESSGDLTVITFSNIRYDFSE
ncbi:MAG: outer membrane lipoprotein carrier protein LolA [Bacteroidales bacterium]|nr:outer membrane lipoprotein carrier protein LolA [Bacteroidales bacterium]